MSSSQLPPDGVIIGCGKSLANYSQEMLDGFSGISMAINPWIWHRYKLRADHMVFVDPPEKMRGQECYGSFRDLLRDPTVRVWTRRRWILKGYKELEDAENTEYFMSGIDTPPEEYFSNKHIYVGDRPDQELGDVWPGMKVFLLSSMLPTFRLMYDMGVRRIYLVGVDFAPEDDCRFPFLLHKFKILRPVFEEAGLDVINCNRESNLSVFRHAPLPTSDIQYKEVEICGS